MATGDNSLNELVGYHLAPPHKGEGPDTVANIDLPLWNTIIAAGVHLLQLDSFQMICSQCTCVLCT